MNQTCTLDGVSFQLKEAHDFSFLRAYGRVFKVFDDQDSGNICFGCQKGGERFFIKYAGAKTMRGCVSPEAAADNLRKTVLLYTALQHENLIELLDTFETSGGFGMVFCWTDAQCMGRQYPEAHARFMQLENIKKLDVFRLCSVSWHMCTAKAMSPSIFTTAASCTTLLPARRSSAISIFSAQSPA